MARYVRRVALLVSAGVLLMGAYAGVAQASQVSQPTVAFASPSGAAGARTIYTIAFTVSSSGALSNTANSQITINFPASTSLNTIVKSIVTDTTTNATVGSCFGSNTTTLTCFLSTGDTIPASHGVSIELDGVTNPSSAGTVNLSVSTTADTTASTSAGYTIGAAGQPSAPTVAFASPSGAAGARTIYTIGFTTSGTGTLSNTANSEITINFPASTNLNTIVKSTVTDTTTNATVGSCFGSNTTTLTCFLSTGDTVPAGHGISIELDGITNPPANTVNLSLSTTSDATTNTSARYTIGPAGQPSPPTVAFASPSGAAGARTIYTIGFTTSGTGTLSNTANSQIVLNFPTSTNLNTIVKSTVTDTTTNATVGSCFGSNTTTLTCFLSTGDMVPAGHGISIELDGVTNPPTNTVNLSLFTTSDTTTNSSARYTIGPAGQPSPPTVAFASPSGAAGARTIYTIGFTTSGTGTLSNTANSQIVVNFPTSTNLNTIVNSIVTDTTTNTRVGSCFGSNTTTLTCFLSTGDTVPAGHGISIELDGVTNPPTNTVNLSLFTTSDTTTNTSAGYTIGPAGHISSPSVTLSNLTPGAGGVTYRIGFTTSGTGTLSNTANSQIVLNFPTSTNLNTIVNSIVTDTTSNTRVGSCFGSNTTTLTCFLSTGETVPAGHGISIELDGVTNPPTISSSTLLSAFTTSDTTSSQSSPYQQGGPPPPPSVTSVSPASGPNTGGTAVTIAGANFTGATAVSFGSTGASFVVNGDSQITATAPAEPAGTIDVTVTTPNGTSQTSAADRYTYTIQITSAGAAPPSVTPSPPSAQSSTSAGLSGQVNPNGLSTTAYFEYGIDPSDRGPGSSTVLYDQTTTTQQVGSDSTDHPISIPVAGLVPNALYHVRIVATNSAGTTVGPDQTFTTPASAPPPPPVLGKAVDVAPVSGVVFIKPPPGKTLAGDITANSAQVGKGQGFVPLTEARQIPSGSQIDALAGSLKLVTATGQVGKTQNGTFGGAIFTLTQDRAGITKGLTNLKLQEGAFQGAPSYATCQAKHKATDATIAALSTKTLQLLKASGHGKFKTTGRYASATVRGTIWTVADRCDGTLTHVIRDTVLVDDFVRHRTILLHSGQSYLAKAPGKSSKANALSAPLL